MCHSKHQKISDLSYLDYERIYPYTTLLNICTFATLFRNRLSMTFSDLNLTKPLLNAIEDKGYITPTHIQAEAFSPIMSGRDVVGIAQTGTGKTLAYLLPCLRMWQFTKERHPQILIIVPTRELSEQVAEEARQLTAHMNTQVVAIYGGTNIRNQIEEVEAGLDMLVATPGRLIDLCLKGALKLKNVKKLVIDEVDEMLNLGFRHQLLNIFDLLPERRQNLMFSATMTDEVDDLIKTFFNAPLLVEAAPAGTPLENIEQYAYDIPNYNSKKALLIHLLYEHPEMDKVLVFVSTKKLGDILHTDMEDLFPAKVGIIHSNKSQNFRFNAVEQFKNGTYRLLIATDIVARGIDITNVSHVINFDLPEVPENYIHRIGRTGRADAKGTAISFIGSLDQQYVDGIEALMNIKIPIVATPDEVELSDELIQEELPDIPMKNILTKGPSVVPGAAFTPKMHVKKVGKTVQKKKRLPANKSTRRKKKSSKKVN